MTPERRAKIDAILQMSHTRDDCDTRFEFRLLQALQDSVAEIDRLNKVVDQAIECSQMSIKAETELCLGFSSRTDVLHEVIRCWYGFGLLGNAPELAAELERRSKA